MNSDLINEYIKYYIEVYNDKNRFNEFINLWSEHSTLIYDNTTYKNQELIVLLTQLYTCSISNTNLNISYMIVGDRRVNILLSYILIDNLTNSKNVSQYIQLAFSNDKKYWIHSSLININ